MEGIRAIFEYGFYSIQMIYRSVKYRKNYNRLSELKNKYSGERVF